ncbi:MAG: hypothetical protein PHV87_06700 [Bacilli bacterium]|nr:hypothetical protein [Bacilli bacterium]
MIMFEVLKKFNLFEKTENVKKFGRGFFNRSYLVYTKDSHYLLEMIEENVFQKPEKAIINYKLVKKYLQKYGQAISFLDDELIDDEQCVVVHINGTYWRGYKLPNHAGLYKKVINNHMIYEIGKAIGHFHYIYKDFPIKELQISIPDYFNLEKELDFLTKTVTKITNENFIFYNDAKFVLDRIEDIKLLNHLLDNGEIPLRIVHNNLRLNNIVFDIYSYQVIGLVGYDAVIPGSLLHDLGAALCGLTATTREDEGNLSLVRINISFFKAFLKGYFEEASGLITQKEIDYIVDATRIMALVNGLKYLNDYFSGNKTYKAAYKEQNIDRARNQFRIVEDIETHYEGMRNVVSYLYNQARNANL